MMGDPKAVHNQDQATAGARDFAGMALAFWRELRAGGMTRDEALRMTIAYTSAFIAGARFSGPPEK